MLDALMNADKTGPTKAAIIDLHMITHTPGKERTDDEFKSLLEKAGFTKIKATRLDNPWYDAVMGYKKKSSKVSCEQQ